MRNSIATSGLLAWLVAVVPAQAPEPPLGDARLSVNTLVREDVFAGFLQNDLSRLARAEKNLDLLIGSRPEERATLLAWQGATALTRAVRAHEAEQTAEFARHYARSKDLFAEAMRLGAGKIVAVLAITGGGQAVLADRLPAAERSAAWELGYTAYQGLWSLQSAIIDKLPLHHKGELLSGLAQTAQRTGRDAEVSVYLERIAASLPDTPYARRAQQWKDDPASRAGNALTCQTCHGPGTLAARMAEVAKQP